MKSVIKSFSATRRLRNLFAKGINRASAGGHPGQRARKPMWEQITSLFGWTAGLGTALAICLVVSGVVLELVKAPYSIDVESVPEGLAKAGLPKEAVTGLLRDDIRGLIDATRKDEAASGGSSLSLVTSDDKAPEISIAGTHLTAHAIAEFIRNFFGWESVKLTAVLADAPGTDPDGSKVLTSPAPKLCAVGGVQSSNSKEPSLWLVLRSHNGRETTPFCGKGPLKDLIRGAAASALEEINPITASSWLLKNEDDSEHISERAKHALRILTRFRIANLEKDKATSWAVRTLFEEPMEEPASLLLEGYAYQRLNNPTRAIKSYDNANRAYKRRFSKRGDWEAALNAKAVVHLQAYEGVGPRPCSGCSQEEEFRSAAKGFMAALDVKPDYDPSRYNLGQIWEYCDQASVYNDFQQDAPGFRILCSSLEKEALAKKLVAPQRLSDAVPDKPCEAESPKARRFLDLALDAYDGVIKSSPSFSIAYFNSARARTMAFDRYACFRLSPDERNALYRDANRLFEDFVELEPKFYLAWLHWGLLNHSMYAPSAGKPDLSKEEGVRYLRLALENYDKAISLPGGAGDGFLRDSRQDSERHLKALEAGAVK